MIRTTVFCRDEEGWIAECKPVESESNPVFDAVYFNPARDGPWALKLFEIMKSRVFDIDLKSSGVAALSFKKEVQPRVKLPSDFALYLVEKKPTFFDLMLNYASIVVDKLSEV